MKPLLLPRRLLVALAIITAALVASWLVQAEGSPLHNYSIQHPAASDAWITINMPSIFLAFTLASNAHTPSVAGYVLGLVLQWGLLGFILSLVIVRHPKTLGH